MDENKKRDFTIGIGVTTTPNRKDCLDMCLDQIRKHTKQSYHLHIHDDVNYRGVAYSKNENIHALRDCDYVFLFDDDCWPINDDWIEFFVTKMQVPTAHLLYLNDKMHTRINTGHDGGIYRYNDCGGVFMSLTRHIINKVGYMNSEYGQYGFEHAGYSNRIYKAKFNTHPYLCAKSTEKYIKSLDYLDAPVKPSVPDYKKQKLIDQNRPIFLKEINSEQIYYPYENTI